MLNLSPEAARIAATIPVYDGPWGLPQANRLLYRAGFGPRGDELKELVRMGFKASVDGLIEPRSAALEGPAPAGGFLENGQLAPATRWGHIHLGFLDRAVRSADPLGERMTLILHDWFALTIAEVDYRWVDNHLSLLRRAWRGSFRETVREVTKDPGMLQLLGGTANHKWKPNENYARELMELFTLGADRGAYTETDVREMARALTGWRMDWSTAERGHNFRFDPAFHDTGTKTLFAGKGWQRRGTLNWSSAVDAVIDHPYHPSFLIPKLWSYFIPTEPSDATQLALENLYRASGEQLLPVVDAILRHPDLYNGPSMLKNPVVYAAGLLRARERSITTDAWVWLGEFAGMLVGSAPNVSGWNDRTWLNTSTFAARWNIAKAVVDPEHATADTYRNRLDETPWEAFREACWYWNWAPSSQETQTAMLKIAVLSPGLFTTSRAEYLAQRQNALRHFVVASPDFHVS